MSERAFTPRWLREDGFTGFSSVEDIRSRRSTVSALPGVYIVQREYLSSVEFLDKSSGGWHKGRDPSVSIENLKATDAQRGLELTDIAYIPGSSIGQGEPMTEREQQRLVTHRLAVIRHAEEVTGNVAQTCRYFGITRQTFYVWLRRHEEKGLEGLRDKSKRPHHSPNATNAEVVGKIIYLRQNYHFGPGKIAMYLKRYHDLTISKSGVWRILQRLELNRLPSSQRHKTYQKRWKRYEKPQPGHRVQVDVKFITPIGAAGKRFYQFTAIDDCTRIRVLRIYPRCNQKTAIQFLDYLLAKLTFGVEVIQTDNGAEFASQFHYHVLDRGIRHVYIKPATPRLNGKVCEDRGGAASGRSDSGQSMTVVSFVRSVDRFRCCATTRSGWTVLT